MVALKKHGDLAARWLKCGWRLYMRNPWLLTSMGFYCAVVAALLAQFPLIGHPLLGLLAPTVLASFYLAIHEVSKQKLKLPPALRMAAIKQAPREFLNVSREEQRLLQVVLIGLYSLTVVVVADILVWMVAGTSWANRADIHVTALPGVIVGASILFAIYLLLAASLAYTLPLALLQREPLVPALTSSLRTAATYALALLAILALLLAPMLVATIAGLYARPLAIATGLIVASVTVPVALCSFYCSYRAVFTVVTGATPVHPPLRRAKHAS